MEERVEGEAGLHLHALNDPSYTGLHATSAPKCSRIEMVTASNRPDSAITKIEGSAQIARRSG